MMGKIEELAGAVPLAVPQGHTEVATALGVRREQPAPRAQPGAVSQRSARAMPPRWWYAVTGVGAEQPRRSQHLIGAQTGKRGGALLSPRAGSGSQVWPSPAGGRQTAC